MHLKDITITLWPRKGETELINVVITPDGAVSVNGFQRALYPSEIELALAITHVLMDRRNHISGEPQSQEPPAQETQTPNQVTSAPPSC